MSHIVKILVPTNSTFQKMHAVKTRKMMISHRLTQVVDERVGISQGKYCSSHFFKTQLFERTQVSCSATLSGYMLNLVGVFQHEIETPQSILVIYLLKHYHVVLQLSDLSRIPA